MKSADQAAADALEALAGQVAEARKGLKARTANGGLPVLAAAEVIVWAEKARIKLARLSAPPKRKPAAKAA